MLMGKTEGTQTAKPPLREALLRSELGDGNAWLRAEVTAAA